MSETPSKPQKPGPPIGDPPQAHEADQGRQPDA